MNSNEKILKTSVLDAIQKDLTDKGCSTKEAIKIIRSMSLEDIGAYYNDKCKKNA